MTKKISISLDDDVFEYLEREFINKSAYINALIRKKFGSKSMTNATNEEEFKGVVL